MKNIISLLYIASLFSFNISHDQKKERVEPVKRYIKQNDLLRYEKLSNQFATNKTLPTGFEIQALVALSHFPELNTEHIEFRFKKAKVAHTSSPSFVSLSLIHI